MDNKYETETEFGFYSLLVSDRDDCNVALAIYSGENLTVVQMKTETMEGLRDSLTMFLNECTNKQ